MTDQVIMCATDSINIATSTISATVASSPCVTAETAILTANETEQDKKVSEMLVDISRALEWSGKTIRIFGTPENPWFHGADIAKALGYVKPGNAIEMHVRSKHKSTGTTLSEIPGMGKLNRYEKHGIWINESGMYSLIMKSELPNVERFQDWITEEVLPSIRRTGGYHIGAQIQKLTTELNSQKLLTGDAQARADAEKKRADNAESDAERARQEAAAHIRQIDKSKADYKTHFRQRNQTVYVLTNDTYIAKDMYKIGKTKNQATGRAGVLNTALIEADSLYVVSEYECADAGEIETAAHKAFTPYRDSPNREFFQLPWSTIDRKILRLINNQDDNYNDSCALVDSTIGVQLPGGADAKAHMDERRARLANAVVPAIKTDEEIAQLAMTTWLSENPNGRTEYTWLKYQPFLKKFLAGRIDVIKKPYTVARWKYISCASLKNAGPPMVDFRRLDLSEYVDYE